MESKSPMMRAVKLTTPGGAETLRITDVPRPETKPGWVLVRIKAFGLNRAEIFTRNGASPSVALPRIIGIECVGEVADPSDSPFQTGQRVISLMGGLGRDFDGSYAEYALIPATQIYPVETDMPWHLLAAIPEMYYTAWSSLVDTLQLASGEHLVIRGGTSSIGLAAIQIGKALGATITATTRSPEKLGHLIQAGADHALLDDDTLLDQMADLLPGGADKLLELVGATTLLSSLGLVKPLGVLCMTGILGGAWTLHDFAPMDEMPDKVRLTVYSGDVVDAHSLGEALAFVEKHQLEPPIARVFHLEDIVEAHRFMESNRANGKIIVMPEQPSP